MNVIAAYGRKYTNIKAARADWFANVDFRMIGGPYINKADADQHIIPIAGNPSTGSMTVTISANDQRSAYPIRIRIAGSPATGPMTVTINKDDTK